jgi:uncharacterized protein YxjI
METTPSLPPPVASPPPQPTGRKKSNAQRPWYWAIGAVAVIWRLGREAIFRNFGLWVGLGVAAAGVITILMWRLMMSRRAKANGGIEFNSDQIREQIAKAGVGQVAFEEDGTLFGSSLLVVNQKSKLIEVNTEYQLFGSGGQVIGAVRQIGQSNWKKFFRFVGSVDQFFTHHFDVVDASGAVLMRITRPRKWFRTTVNVFDGRNQFIGSIRQQNVFGKIRFALQGPTGDVIGWLSAENWRAWDFAIQQPSGLEVARVTKSWEGWVRTFATNADHYVVRVHHRLGDPLRMLVFATALSIDLALKQDARGFGG